MTAAGTHSTQQTVARFASDLIAALAEERRFLPEGPVPTTAEQALEVHAALAERFGPVGAFKVANKPGAPFVMAPIWQHMVFPSGAQVPMLDRVGIELEVGFRLLSVPPVTEDPAVLAQHLQPVAVIELVDTRIDGPLAEDPFVKLADQQANRALIVGEALGDWDGRDFTEVGASLSHGGQTLLDGRTRVPGISAMRLVLDLMARIGTHCGGLQPGQIVITGSLNGLPYVTDPAVVDGRIADLGHVGCTLVRD